MARHFLDSRLLALQIEGDSVKVTRVAALSLVLANHGTNISRMMLIVRGSAKKGIIS